MSSSSFTYARIGRKLLSDREDFNSLLVSHIGRDSTDFVTKFSKLHVSNASTSFIISSVLKRALSGQALESFDTQVLETLLTPLIRGRSEGNSPERQGASRAHDYQPLPELEGTPVTFSNNLVEQAKTLVKDVATNLVPPPASKIITSSLDAISANPIMSDGERLNPIDYKNKIRPPNKGDRLSRFRLKQSRPLTSLAQPTPKRPQPLHPRRYEICDLQRGGSLFWEEIEQSKAFETILYSPDVDVPDAVVTDRMNRWRLHTGKCQICERCAKHIPTQESGDWNMQGTLRDIIALLHAYSHTEQSGLDGWLDTVDIDKAIQENYFGYGINFE